MSARKRHAGARSAPVLASAAALGLVVTLATSCATGAGSDAPNRPSPDRTRFGVEQQAALHKATGFYSQGEYASAFEAAKAALTTGNDSMPAWDLISRIYIEAGQDEQAAEFFEIATEDVGGAPAHYYHGFHLFRLNRWDEAVAAFRAAAGLDPANPDIRFREGLTLKARGDFEGAVAALTEARRLAPGRPDIAYNLSRFMKIIGDDEGSRRIIEEFHRDQPESGEMLYAAAQVDLRDGNTDRAETRLRRAVQLSPGLREAHHDLSRVLALKGDEAGARDARRVYRRLSDYHETLSALAKKMAVDPKDPEPLLTAAELHLAEERWAEALRTVSRAEDRDADPLRVACIRAEAYSGSRAAGLVRENLDKAQALLAESAAPSTAATPAAKARVSLARAAARMASGDEDQAPPLLASAAAPGAPEDRLFHLRVGDAWRRLGREAESRAAYDRAYSYPRPR